MIRFGRNIGDFKLPTNADSQVFVKVNVDGEFVGVLAPPAPPPPPTVCFFGRTRSRRVVQTVAISLSSRFEANL